MNDRRFFSWLVLGLALFGATAQTLSAGHLVNRYSFTTDASDAVGGADGQLVGGAIISNNAVVLNGSDGYVNLPNNLCTGMTSLSFEAWVTESGSAAWARLFDFGNSSGGEDAQGGGTSYMFVAWPGGSGNYLRASYRLPGAAEMLLDVSPRPTQGFAHHFVWTQDGVSNVARIYLDGVLTGTYANFTATPADVGPTVNDWLGRSQYNDPYFKGSIDEFRIYDFALSAEQIASNFALGPDTAPLGPARFLVQPQSLTLAEGDAFTLAPDVTGASPFAFQWYRNATPIPDATNESFTAVAAVSDNNAVFSLWVTNRVTNTVFSVASSNAVLQVVADTNPPVLLLAASVGTNGVEVRFSEPLRADTATNLANYSLAGPGGSVALDSPVAFDSGRVVSFACAPLAVAATYTLTVSGVRDQSAAGNSIAAGSQARFSATPLSVRDVGAPAVAGLLQYTASGALALTAAGADIGGGSDQCSMTEMSLTGDFDRQVRLTGLLTTEVWSKAGLMARETFDGSSPCVAALASPGAMGCFFSARSSAGAVAAVSGQFPVNYPQTWLRLRRAGNLFTGYASYDGITWTALGNATLALSNTLQVGVALASHASGTAATATFSEAGDTVSPTVGVVANPSEALGPSSRRTQLVLSEIMYKPAARGDGRSVEFIEIYNSNPWFHDVSGHRLAGDVQFTFPAHTVIPGGGFLVVAAVPADVQAVYGLAGVLGPYTGSLKTKSTLQLYDEANMLLLEVGYDSVDPWPMGADGTGHSIVLARPSYGEADPRAWDRSDTVGGSPGAFEAYRPDPLRSVVLNEILAHTDLPDVDSIELYNHANTPVDLGGCTLSDDPAVNKFIIPTNTVIPARGFVFFTEAQLGFGLNAAGETLYFKNPDASRVLDALKFDAQENGVSFGRSPDGAAQWYRLAARTFGTNNSAPLLPTVGINEIMYHPISGLDDDQYVELFNRGTNAVSLAGWKFVAGISYVFAANTTIAPGGYLVVGANTARLLTNYAQLNATNTVGNFSGRLSGSGERLALAMPDEIVSTNASGYRVTNHLDIIVDEVTYGTGGRWGQWSDGGGSSLELVNAVADHRLAPNWADSDESAKAGWTTIEATGVLDNGANYGSEPIGHAQLGLLDAGECLIDGVEVRPGTNGANYVANPDFNAGLTNWSLQGAFSRSSLQATQGYGGGAALQLRTGNRLFTLGNSAQCALTNTTLASGNTATLRFKARWLRGCPDLVFRLNGNWLEAPGTMPVPANLGTPGLRNSAAISNAPPAVWGVTHTPALPAAGDAVVVTARVSDLDSAASLQLLFRVDPSASYITYLMRDDGTGGDAVAGDGVFSATLPARPAGATVAFVVQATDSRGGVARFPAPINDNGPVRECVIHYGDPEPPGGFGIYHFWLTQTNVNRWLALPIMSNEEMDATLVYRGRIIYNASARYSGSPYHESVDGPVGVRACHYIWSMPKDDLFLGTAAFNKLHWPGNDIQDDTTSANNNDPTLQREQAANTLLRGLGAPWVSRRYVVVYANGVRRGLVMEDALRPSGSVPDAFFPGDTGGYLYKIQPWFEGTALPNASGFIAWNNKAWATINPYRTTGGAYKQARYRWHYEARDVPGTANDYTNVFTLLDAFNAYNAPDYARIVNSVVDVDQWLRMVAANHAAGNWDCYGIQNGQNVFGYVSPQRRWQLFMFDFNIVLGNRISWGPGENLEATPETGWEKLYGATGLPEFRRRYWRALKELVNGPLQASVCNPLLEAKYAAFQASGIGAASPLPIESWLASARTSIGNQVASHDAPAFALQSASATTASNMVVFSGTAPLEVDSFTVGGCAATVQWTSLTNWTLLAPVPTGTNMLAVLGYDRKGNPLPGVSNVLTVGNSAAPESPDGKVVFNEIMHHPARPGADYVEVLNTATNTAFDLGGWQVNGLSYAFPTGTVILPQKLLVLAHSRNTFANTYGATNWVADVYDGSLQPDGETLSLLRPGAVPGTQVVVDRVRYETNAPWAAAANQPGVALQLRDARQDNSRAANWATGHTNYDIPVPQWIRVSTNIVAATSSRLYLYLLSAGDLYVDDVKLVAGYDPDAGANLLTNAGFESALGTGWTLVGNHTSSVESTAVKHGGTNSLHLIATGVGTGSGNSLYQTNAVTLTNGAMYTASFWYLQGTNASSMVVRFSSGAATPVFNVALSTNPPATLCTPGATNSVATALPAFPTLWLNELQAENLTGPLDNAGQRDPWLEIYNPGTATQSLAGLYLGTNYGNPALWAFPSNASIAPGQFLVVWADGQAAQTTGAVLHTSFRPSPGSGSVMLSRFVSNTVQIVDYLNYSALPANYSYGAVPDGQPFYRQPMFRASPAGTNNAAWPPITVFINEWMAENTGFLTDPATGKYEDWFELYNPSDSPADLAGYYLTDMLGNPFQYQIPAGYRVPAHGYLLVWADSKSSANSTSSPALHTNFKLAKEGEALGLFAGDGTLMDYVAFGAQTANISEGRYPDSGSVRLFMDTPSPGAANILPPAPTLPAVSAFDLVTGGPATLTVSTWPGHTYRVEFKDALGADTWTPVGPSQIATGATLYFTDCCPTAARRFYRVVLLD